MQRNLAEERNTLPLRLVARPAMAENIRARAALRAEEIAHILYNPKHRNIDAVEHGNSAPRIDQREILRCRDDHRTLERYLLRHGELRVAGAGRHIHDENVERAPFHLAQHLRQRRDHHGPAPDHRRFLVDEESDGHHSETVARDWLEPRTADRLRPLSDCEELWQRWPVDIGIENADF